MFTIKDIEKECCKLSEMVGDEFNLPISINGRLTRTLGRVHSECINEVWYPVRMEISKQLLETSTEASIKAVISHEWAHYYTTKSTGESHGHDAVFKKVCARVGCSNSGTTTKVERTVSERSLFKYTVHCHTCNEDVGHYNRMCATLKNLNDCVCNKCGTSNLSYTQNW